MESIYNSAKPSVDLAIIYSFIHPLNTFYCMWISLGAVDKKTGWVLCVT